MDWSSVKRRNDLKQTLDKYISDTFTYIHVTKTFCDNKMKKWYLQREKNLGTMKGIKDRADNKTSVKLIPGRRQELEKDLGAVLKNILDGLRDLLPFLEAVEKLSVTSPFIFTDACLPIGVSAEHVHSVIFAARVAAPLLVHFKRDDKSFFLPSLSNVEVLVCYLDKYMSLLQKICERMEESMKSIPGGESCRWPNKSQAIRFSMCEEEFVQKMMSHCRQLDIIRNDPDFRLTFLFQEYAQSFICVFGQSNGRMRDFLSDLEECARKLDKLKFGVNVSSVAGSSLSIVGGILSIVGLALIPVTAGVSLGLTVAGISCGVASGANSLVTGVTEMAVSKKHRHRSEKTFQCFMKDVQALVDCMEKAASSAGPANRSEQIRALINNKGEDVVKIGQAGFKLSTIGKGIDNLVDTISAVKALQLEEVAPSAVEIGVQGASAGRNIPKLAADLPDVGQVAKVTPRAMSKATRSGFIALNAFFIGVDVFFICKDSISLYKGSEHEIAHLIRSRAGLWRSELDCWEKIHNSLCRGLREFSSSQEILEQPFYPICTP